MSFYMTQGAGDPVVLPTWTEAPARTLSRVSSPQKTGLTYPIFIELYYVPSTMLGSGTPNGWITIPVLKNGGRLINQ